MSTERVSGPRPVRAVARLSMIGVSQVMAILLCGVVVNNYYGLYASWDDLLGDTGSPGVIIHQNTVAAGTPISGGDLTDGRAMGGPSLVAGSSASTSGDPASRRSRSASMASPAKKASSWSWWPREARTAEVPTRVPSGSRTPGRSAPGAPTRISLIAGSP